MQQNLWIAAGGLAALAVVGQLAEHRRQRRTDFDKVGWMPWPLVQFASLFGALIVVVVALVGG